MESGLNNEQILIVTAVSAAISLLGTLIGITIKDYFFSRAFESWKQRKDLEKLYRQFRDPLLLSAKELCDRLKEILDYYPIYYLKSDVLEFHQDKPIREDTDDPYFQRYKLISTVYRICSFLGWLELSRQEIVFLNSGNNKHWKKLDNTLAKIRRDFADGDLIDSNPDWKDMLIFREEIRAIGESMLEPHGNLKTVIGYGKFCDLFDSKDNKILNRWISVVLNFILDCKENLDFRKCRLILLTNHLVDLIELLDNIKLEERFLKTRTKFSEESKKLNLLKYI